MLGSAAGLGGGHPPNLSTRHELHGLFHFRFEALKRFGAADCQAHFVALQALHDAPAAWLDAWAEPLDIGSAIGPQSLHARLLSLSQTNRYERSGQN